MRSVIFFTCIVDFLSISLQIRVNTRQQIDIRQETIKSININSELDWCNRQIHRRRYGVYWFTVSYKHCNQWFDQRVKNLIIIINRWVPTSTTCATVYVEAPRFKSFNAFFGPKFEADVRKVQCKHFDGYFALNV